MAGLRWDLLRWRSGAGVDDRFAAQWLTAGQPLASRLQRRERGRLHRAKLAISTGGGRRNSRNQSDSRYWAGIAVLSCADAVFTGRLAGQVELLPFFDETL
ncbi:hypothetical protein GCM10009565_75930 [Amycolatopsis albidoflavus]